MSTCMNVRVLVYLHTHVRKCSVCIGAGSQTAGGAQREASTADGASGNFLLSLEGFGLRDGGL